MQIYQARNDDIIAVIRQGQVNKSLGQLSKDALANAVFADNIPAPDGIQRIGILAVTNIPSYYETAQNITS